MIIGPARRTLTELLANARDRRARRISPPIPSSSSMRSSWLYFATRSLRLADPVLIWPADVPTARSAIVLSSVSPERCEMIVPYPRVSRHRDRVERFGDRADLIQLHQQRVADPVGDPPLQDLGVGDEHIVADQLHAIAERARQRLPAVPVAFGEPVFDRHDRVLPHPVAPEIDHLRGRPRRLAGFLEDVLCRCPTARSMRRRAR